MKGNAVIKTIFNRETGEPIESDRWGNEVFVLFLKTGLNCLLYNFQLEKTTLTTKVNLVEYKNKIVTFVTRNSVYTLEMEEV